MKKIVYTRADGGVSVFNPAPGARLAFANGEFAFDRPYKLEDLSRKAISAGEFLVVEDDEAFLLRLAAKVVPPDATNIQFLAEEDIPADRTFRNAWEQGDKVVAVNMPKARDLHRDKLRGLRSSEFEPLERQQRTALSTGDIAAAQAIEAKLQALRDVTADPAIEAARTPDELKAVLPEPLRGKAAAAPVRQK